jgi:uncharacterized membrane protein YkoI
MYARKTAILAIALFLATTGFASADEKDAAQSEAVKRAKVSLNDAVAIAQKQVPDGRVLDTDVETVKGVVQYAIEIEKDGIKVVFVDLQSGNVIRMVPKRETEDDDDDED